MPSAYEGTDIISSLRSKYIILHKKDFVAKLEIALKESNETSYWLKMMYETKRIDTATYQYTEKLCGNVRRLIIASYKTARRMRNEILCKIVQKEAKDGNKANAILGSHH